MCRQSRSFSCVLGRRRFAKRDRCDRMAPMALSGKEAPAHPYLEGLTRVVTGAHRPRRAGR